MLGVAACEDKGIGLPCELEGQSSRDGGTASTPRTTQVIAQAVECPESICIQMAERPASKLENPQPQAYCTAKCSNDSDCEGGQNCWHVDPVTQIRTKLRFRCVKPIVISTDVEDPDEGGGLFCDGLCICESDARRQTNPVVMEPDEDCPQNDPDLCENWVTVEPPQCRAAK